MLTRMMMMLLMNRYKYTHKNIHIHIYVNDADVLIFKVFLFCHLRHHDGGGEVFLQEQQGSVQIRVVELIWHTPTDGPELPSLLDDAMEETDGIEQGAPFVMVHLPFF